MLSITSCFADAENVFSFNQQCAPKVINTIQEPERKSSRARSARLNIVLFTRQIT
jgi:hypothetical protein